MRRDQSAGGGDDPAVAPAHDGLHASESGNCVAACGHPNSVRTFENGGAVPDIDDRPAGNRRRPGFRRRHQGLPHRDRQGAAFAWEAGPAAGRAPPANRADGLGMLPTMAGESDADAVFRAPSILPLDRVSEIRGAGVSFCATSTRPSSLANCGQFRPPAHPSPKLATTAAATSTAARARSPNGSRTTNTASRSDLRKFHRLARCSRHWPATTFPDQMLSKVLGSRSCMA